MNTAAARSLGAQAVVGLALCLGGYVAVVMPLRERAAGARADLAEIQAQFDQATALEASMESVLRRGEQADRRATEIERGGELARSQEALYASINTAAVGLGIRIDEFTPVQAPDSQLRAGQGRPLPGDAVLRCRFAATGSYTGMARLMRTISGDGGFSAVRSVRLLPDATGASLYAEIELEHYAVDPEARRLAGSEGAP